MPLIYNFNQLRQIIFFGTLAVVLRVRIALLWHFTMFKLLECMNCESQSLLTFTCIHFVIKVV